MSRRILRTIAALLMAVCCSVAVMAQSETGQIVGTVKDPTGAVVSGANVTIKSVETGAERASTTNELGNYIVTNLQPGAYEVVVQAAGFAATTAKVQVTVGSRVGVDIALALSEETNVVEVIANDSGIQVNTVTQELANVVNRKQIVELPTITRNPYALVALSGNVSPGDPTGRGVGFAINGQRAASTNVMLDGADNNDAFTASVGQNVPLDSVQEFSVITNNFSAEFGRASGGIVNLVTKAGTNEFHGSIYEFNRISELASNDFDSNAQGLKKGVFTRNQFGYSVGGPVIKNKAFFFNSGEFIRVRSVLPVQFLVATPALIANTAPNTQEFFRGFDTVAPINGRIFTRAEVPGVNPNGAFGRLPANLPVFGVINTTISRDAGGGDPQNTYQNVTRVDLNINSKTSLYARYAIEDSDLFEGVVGTSPYKGFSTGQTQFNQNVLLSLTRVITPRLTSQTKFVFNRLNNQQPLGSQPAGPTLYALGTTRVRLGSAFLGFPGYLPFSPGSAIPFGGPQNFTQIFQDINYNIGRHELRFGGSFVNLQDNRTFGAFQNAVETLGSNLGQALDNLVMGRLRSFQAAVDPQGKFPGEILNLPVGSPSFSRSNLFNDSSLYVNDTIRIHPRVTLNLGLRYEYYGVQHNKDPQLDANFYFGEGATIFEKIKNGKVFRAPDSPVGGLVEKDLNNFAPRVGIAWDVFGNGKTSLRGGYGLGYERNFGNVTFNVIQNPPNYAVISIAAPTDQPVIPITRSNSGPLSGSGTKALPVTSLRHVNQNIRTAYAHLYSVSLQQQLLKNIVVSVDYSGSLGRDLYSLEDPNRPGSLPFYLGDTSRGPLARLNRQYSNINTRGNNGFSRYDALTISVDSNNIGNIGLLLTTKYTYSHSIDNLSSTFSESANNFNLGLLDPFNPELDKGNADFDIRHRFVTSGVWEIPFARSMQGAKKLLFDGFGVSYIFTAQTGLPFSIYDCTNGFATCIRLLEGTKLSRTGNEDNKPVAGMNNLFNFIDLSSQQNNAGSFVNPITGTSDFGPFPSNMTARNAFRGPGRWNLDAVISKRVNFKEKYSLQLRMEVFNVFNHANLFIQGENAEVSNGFVPAFRSGRRQVQLAAKFLF